MWQQREGLLCVFMYKQNMWADTRGSGVTSSEEGEKSLSALFQDGVSALQVDLKPPEHSRTSRTH